MQKIKLKERTLSALEKVLTGDKLPQKDHALAPYQSGPKLVQFFREFGSDDVYGSGFPSRPAYTLEKLQSYNGTIHMQNIVETALAPVHFFHSGFEVDNAISYVNQYLALDGFQVAIVASRAQLQLTDGIAVKATSKLPSADPLSQAFMLEQCEKCDRKLAEADYDGAITNARSYLEAILYELELQLSSERTEYDGDLQKLYKRVQKLLNLDPEKGAVSESLKMVLRGLSSIVAGLAPLRNKMGDAHVRTHKPERHHAKLAVNAARTLTDFLIDSFDYQRRTGRITTTDIPKTKQEAH